MNYKSNINCKEKQETEILEYKGEEVSRPHQKNSSIKLKTIL